MGLLFLCPRLLYNVIQQDKCFSGYFYLFLGTLLGGLSPHFATLLVARIIQALGAGIMMPLMMTTILMFSNRMNAVNIWGYLVW